MAAIPIGYETTHDPETGAATGGRVVYGQVEDEPRRGAIPNPDGWRRARAERRVQ